MGARLGAGVPKALVRLGGRPLLEYSLGAIAANGHVDRVVIAAPAAHLAEVVSLAGPWEGRVPVLVVEGGSSRQRSVALALESVGPDIGTILVHDAARPFATPELFERVRLAVGSVPDGAVPDGAVADGAVPVLRPVDTVKRLADVMVVVTLARGGIGLAQTPQAFRTDVLRAAHAAAARDAVDATDDAALVEWIGGIVVAVPGDPGNVKVTTAEDLASAQRRVESVRV
jgi:2-C-methyl-D-erythritol 4-phosphate cytidylyltransferase